MSLVEDETRERNLQALKERIDAEAEHRVEAVRAGLASAACYDPIVVAFKKQRQEQAAQIRWWKPSLTPMFPKKRQFHGGIDIHE
jgi:hypothetical protein